MHDAMRVVKAVRDIDVYIEQPCRTYEECLTIRQHCDHPFVLDENIDSLDVLLRGHADRAMDVVNIKISKFGGLTKARQARDLCVSLGVAMTIEDSWGGDIVTAAIAHLAHSTPTEFLFTTTDLNSYVTVSFADGAPQRTNGRMSASTQPGLGVTPKFDVIDYVPWHIIDLMCPTSLCGRRVGATVVCGRWAWHWQHNHQSDSSHLSNASSSRQTNFRWALLVAGTEGSQVRSASALVRRVISA